MQLRNPNTEEGRHQQRPPGRPNNSSSDDDTATATLNDKCDGNHAIVLHSPILSSIIPNSNIKQFESDFLKRQAEYAARVTDLEGRLALFHTRLAVECAERGRDHSSTMEDYVVGPLDHAMRRCLDTIEGEFVRPIMDPKRATMVNAGSDRGSGLQEVGSVETRSSPGEEKVTGAEQEVSKNNNDNTISDTSNAVNLHLPNLVSIERQTNLLEARMNQHHHVTLFHSRRQNYDVIDKACRQSLQPSLALEVTKADKREVGMARRFESSSGEYARLLSEMISRRTSSLGYIEKEINDWVIGDEKRAEQYLDDICKLKQMVLEAREERMCQDKVVVDNIIRAQKMLQEEIYFTC